ncbi:MAG: hypothetical protein BWY74_04286 [Firmicutes bacterium ADurb.Bin419]|nr:MAG: hypothetical protein BWY74_04286 [Firmicutes bacterium ADurb.Bin419]
MEDILTMASIPKYEAIIIPIIKNMSTKLIGD